MGLSRLGAGLSLAVMLRIAQNRDGGDGACGRDMANSRVENVVTETLRRYQIQEEFEARWASACPCFAVC